MKKILVVVFALFACSAAFAQTSGGLYVGLDVKYDMMEIGDNLEYNNIGFTFNVGKAFPAGAFSLRPEGSFTYALKDADDDFTNMDYSYMGAMFNLYLDIPLTETVVVYPTAGVGMRFHDLEGFDKENSLTWQAGAGIRFNVTPQNSVDLTARYVNSGKPEFTPNSDAEVVGWDFALGFKYWF